MVPVPDIEAPGLEAPGLEASSGLTSDLRGASRLVVETVAGVTGIVESMHRNISGLAPVVGRSREEGTKGITGLVYRSIRGVTRMTGAGLDLALSQLVPLLERHDALTRREAVSAALNGAFGDYLVATGNPLAISIQLRTVDQPLDLERRTLQQVFPSPPAKLLLWIHGLGMNDRHWHHNGQGYGTSIARDIGCQSLYLRYNSGLPISTNGRQLSNLLERLVQEWPVPVRELVVIGYSMGGLVARSACHHAELEGHGWPHRLTKLVFLGTPHLGAPLERAGSWVDRLLAISPYSAPLARLGKMRSAGVQDLRYGNFVEADRQAVGAERRSSPRKQVPLPEGVRCFAIAATQQTQPVGDNARLRGDGLVPVKSALGQHHDPARSLPIPASNQWILYGASHFDLLDSQEVGKQLDLWLAHDRSPRKKTGVSLELVEE